MELGLFELLDLNIFKLREAHVWYLLYVITHL